MIRNALLRTAIALWFGSVGSAVVAAGLRIRYGRVASGWITYESVLVVSMVVLLAAVCVIDHRIVKVVRR
ncbi:MAG: hypothetical protein JWM89_1524 [Acidimicrobiales bacterium]|nr:hypothetical protein [Acidimicrobiales bacterium]